MEHHIVRGNPVQVNWTFNSIAGGEFSLAGYYYRLYYLQGTQSVLATGVTHSGNTLTWSFIPDNQWKSGYYDIMLEIFSNTKKILTITYPEVFNLVPAATTSETSTAVQNAVSTIDIESSCDFNRFTPVIPTVGNDNKWYVDGEPVLDPSGHQVYATGRGVTSINKTATSGNIDTYTITYTDNTTQSFTVTNGIDGEDGEDGIGITNIAKTSASANVDIYTITMANGQTYTFNVTNGIDGEDGEDGKGISSIIKTSASGNVDTYTITYTDNTTQNYTVTNGIDGEDGEAATLEVDSVAVSTGAAGSTASVNVENVGSENAARLQFSFTIPKGDKGDTGSGLIIKGKVATTNNLPSSNRQVGDAYLCEADNYIYIWSGSDWFTMSTTGYQKPSTGIPLEDLSSSVQTSLGKADTALQSHQSISGKADKVSSATINNFAALDASGNLKDSGKKASDFITAHQDISGKADKVSNATNGNFAALDSNGNLTDSGHKHSDYLTQHQDISGKADKATTLAGYGITDANISNGVITLGSNTITPITALPGVFSTSANGLVPAASATGDTNKFLKGDGTWATPAGSSGLSIEPVDVTVSMGYVTKITMDATKKVNWYSQALASAVLPGSFLTSAPLDIDNVSGDWASEELKLVILNEMGTNAINLTIPYSYGTVGNSLCTYVNGVSSYSGNIITVPAEGAVTIRLIKIGGNIFIDYIDIT